jgi:hypothetical protein
MDELLALVDDLVKIGCHCDLMYGYQCPIHFKAGELKARIKGHFGYDSDMAFIRSQKSEYHA